MLTALKTEPLRERVLTELRRKIFSGTYPPGHELNLEYLENEFECSRTPIRESLQLLSEEGLIDYTSSQKACVKDISIDFVEDYFNTRKWLESIALERAYVAGLDVSLLQEYLEEETEAYIQDDRETLAACNKRLQHYIYHACDSPLLETYLIDLWKAAPRRYLRSDVAKRNFIDKVFEYHKDLTAALCANDIELAKKYSDEQFDWLKHNYVSYRQKDGPVG